MTAPALEALAAAKAAGVTIILEGQEIFVEAKNRSPPPHIVVLLRTVKPDLLRVLTGREAAHAAFNAHPPPDCSEDRWAVARQGLQYFVEKGFGDQAALLGWTIEELYGVPPLWARIDQTGAALLAGDRRVIALTENSIAIETHFGSHLKFRRIGREHIA